MIARPLSMLIPYFTAPHWTVEVFHKSCSIFHVIELFIAGRQLSDWAPSREQEVLFNRAFESSVKKFVTMKQHFYWNLPRKIRNTFSLNYVVNHNARLNLMINFKEWVKNKFLKYLYCKLKRSWVRPCLTQDPAQGSFLTPWRISFVIKLKNYISKCWLAWQHNRERQKFCCKNRLKHTKLRADLEPKGDIISVKAFMYHE